MGLYQKLEEMAYTIEGTHPITDRDELLAQIGMDPTEARFHPGLHRESCDDLATDIDKIFVAANAGDRRAEFLILAAANNQVRGSYPESIATDEPLKPVDKAVEHFEKWYPAERYENTPLSREEALRELDGSIARIELAIEDAKHSSLEQS